MTRFSSYFLLLVFGLGLSLAVDSQELKLPRLNSPIVDETSLLSTSEKNQLNAKIRRLRKIDGPQIGVVILKSLEGNNLEETAMSIAEKWQLGGKEKDDGVLLLIASKERQMRIEIGGGLEGEITDYEAYQIIDQVLTPEFKNKRFFSGISGFIDAVAAKFDIVLEDQQRASPLKNAIRPKLTGLHLWFSLLFPFLIIAVLAMLHKKRLLKTGLLFVLFSLFFYFTRAKGIPDSLITAAIFSLPLGLLGPRALLFILLAGLGRSLSSGGGGRIGGGGGGFGGGGGGFSGGGASGSW